MQVRFKLLVVNTLIVFCIGIVNIYGHRVINYPVDNEDQLVVDLPWTRNMEHITLNGVHS